MSTEVSKATRATTPWWSRKSTVVLVTLLLGVAVFGTTTQTWVSVVPAGSGVKIPPIHVAGSKAATSVTALAVVAVAGSIAVSIASKWVRWVIAALLLLAGSGIVVAGSAVILAPKDAAAGAVATATGMSGGPQEVTLSAFPAIAVVLGALLVLCGVWMVLAGRRWSVQRSRYDRNKTNAVDSAADPDEPLDAIDGWDRLSRGEDPS